MYGERGQASVEWTAALLLVASALGAAGRLAQAPDGRSLGGFLAHAIVCAAAGRCDDGNRELSRAYGPGVAALVREHAPGLVYEPGERSLPVDYRRCRRRSCSDAPDERDLDVHRSAAGARATAFTRVVRRGGRLYAVYWLYYPDSNSHWAGSDAIWRHSPLRLFGRYPGFHPDDWEAYEVVLDGDGSALARASSHGHWQGCKQRACRNRWIPASGWTRVSEGSHAGHIPARARMSLSYYLMPWRRQGPRSLTPLYPGVDLRERTTSAAGLRLVPLESLPAAAYRPLPGGVDGPWSKAAYRDPATDSS